jgi:hypothetical protein
MSATQTTPKVLLKKSDVMFSAPSRLQRKTNHISHTKKVSLLAKGKPGSILFLWLAHTISAIRQGAPVTDF